jgi:UDP-N-acetylmuramoyl-tripeptide--D-alanyl-D-alanine ligase
MDGGGPAVIEVADSRVALGCWGGWNRERFGVPVIAVAGSNGKTSTKDMLASVLGAGFETLASEASYNNDIGVPLTLLGMERRHGVVVVEAGTNHPGELPALLRRIRPTLGVLTSLGREHLEYFGSFEGVVEEEGWLAEMVPAGGRVFVGGDSPGIGAVVRRARAAVTRVGWGEGNDWRVAGAEAGSGGRGQRFWLETGEAGWSGEYTVAALGRHQAANAALALAVGAGLGMDPDRARIGLGRFQASARRMQLWEGEEWAVVDDCYNANADSMGAALETLRDLPRGGRRVAVLGDMAELGAWSEAAHIEVGEKAAAVGVELLVAVGGARGFGGGGGAAGGVVAGGGVSGCGGGGGWGWGMGAAWRFDFGEGIAVDAAGGGGGAAEGVAGAGMRRRCFTI